MRDIVSGLLALWAAVFIEPRALSSLLALFALIPAGDAVIVTTSGGSISAAVGIHGATVLVMVVGALLLRTRRTERSTRR